MKLTWDFVASSRAPRISKEFGRQLVPILHDKYLVNDWSVREVCEYINDRSVAIVNERQLNHLLKQHGMLKKDRPRASHVSRDLERDMMSATPSSDSVRSEDYYSARSVSSRASATPARRLFDPHAPSLDCRSESAQTFRSAQAPEDIHAQDADPTNQTRSDLPHDDRQSTRPETRNETSTVDNTGHTASSTASGHSLAQNLGGELPGESHAAQASRALEKDCSSVMQELRALNELCGDPVQLSDVQGPSGHIQHDGGPALSKEMTARVTSDLSIAMDMASMRKASVILGAFFDSSREDPTLKDLSDTELHASLRLALVMRCCGRNDDASRCLEFLLCRWHTKETQPNTEPDLAAPEDTFLNLTTAFTWLLQTDRNDLDNGKYCGLWVSCWEIQRLYRQQNGIENSFTLSQVLAIGRLALVAYLMGYESLFEELREFWGLRRGVELSMGSSKGVRHRQQALFNYIDRKIANPRLTLSIRPQAVPRHGTITTGIGRLVSWIREQLLSPPSIYQGEVVSPAEMWRRICPPKCTSHLEQQLLLSFLLYQGSVSNTPWNLHLDDTDRELLPWNITLEWLSGEVPILTLSVLSSLIKCKDEWPPALMSPIKWFERTQVAVDALLQDIEATTARFYHDVWVSCPDPVWNDQPGGRLISWVSPVQFDAPDTLPGTGDLTRHLTCSVALSGSVGLVPVHPSAPVDADARDQTAALRFEHYDPTWSRTPRSSLSGFESLKSVCLRVRDSIHPNRMSTSTHSSRSLRRLSCARSSVTRNAVDTWMHGAQGSFITSPWSIANHGRRDEIVSMTLNEDPMDLDT